jgi:PPOX class probable F420-dependent enzyme
MSPRFPASTAQHPAEDESSFARFLCGRDPVSTGMTHQLFVDPHRKGRPADLARQVAAQILAGPHLSVLTTANEDGSPQASVILVKPDGDDIYFSTIKGRRKTANMQRDPRVSLLVHSLPGAAGEFTYAVLSGAVELTDDPDASFHQVMYDLHMGGAPAPVEPGAERLIVRLRPQRVYAPPSFVIQSD